MIECGINFVQCILSGVVFLSSRVQCTFEFGRPSNCLQEPLFRQRYQFQCGILTISDTLVEAYQSLLLQFAWEY